MKLIFFIVNLLAFGCVNALTLDELERTFRVQRLKIEAEEKSESSALRSNYLAALSKLQQRIQITGDLNKTLLVRKEMEHIKSATWPLASLEQESPKDLVKARRIFFKQFLAIQQESSKSLIKIADRMDQLLERKVIELTKIGDLEGAKSAKRMKESLMSDQIIVSARTLVKRIRPNGSSPVAMRIRRAGDQLEVLVRYDARGEVSLKSSVENVTEKTGVTKDKGSTRAKTLGSFIGAKGFTVDPYVSYSNDFKKGDLGAARSYSLELEHKKEDKETTGTRIRIPAKAENPRIYFPGVVPPLSKKGTFRLRARYYVPTTNKSIVGIQFSQSAGPLPGGIGGKKGAWADLEFTYEATAEADGLFFYHVCSRDVPVAARAGEYASLAELTITHESFSAYLVERFDEHGAVAGSSTEATDQKAVVTNGILLPF